MKNVLTIAIAALTLTCLCQSSAKAQEPQLNPVSGYQTLLDAITKCPAANNPMTVLTQLKGDAFTDVKTGEDAGTMTALVIDEPTNIHMKRPTRLLAHIYVQMSVDDGGNLVCGVTQSKP